MYIKPDAATMTNPETPVVLVGPSGVGKTTLIKMLCEKYPRTFSTCVTHTTRAPRPGEVNAVHYHFVDDSQMLRLIVKRDMIEYALVHDNVYGVSKTALLDARRTGIPLLVLDVQGARALSDMHMEFESKLVFIAPPSLTALRARLEARGTESPESLRRRMRTASVEMDGQNERIWNAEFTNDDLGRCFAELCEYLESEFDLLRERK